MTKTHINENISNEIDNFTKKLSKVLQEKMRDTEEISKLKPICAATLQTMFWSKSLKKNAQLVDLLDKSGAINMVDVINIQS